MTDRIAKVIAWAVIALGFVAAIAFAWAFVSAALDWPSSPSWWEQLDQHERDAWLAMLIVVAAVFIARAKR